MTFLTAGMASMDLACVAVLVSRYLIFLRSSSRCSLSRTWFIQDRWASTSSRNK